MRQTAVRLNRAWLTIIGILLLLAGLLVIAIGTGLLATGTKAVGLTLNRPGPANRLFGSATSSTFALTWVVVVVGIVGVILGLLGLAWLIAQIPRSNETTPFRLHDDAAGGLTRCSPSVLTHAVEDQIETLPGVQNASAVLRGTAQNPDLTVKVTASDRTNIPVLLQLLQNQVAADFSDSLDTHLQRLGVQIEIDSTKTSVDHVTM